MGRNNSSASIHNSSRGTASTAPSLKSALVRDFDEAAGNVMLRAVHLDLWQQVGQCTHSGGLAGATVAHDHDTTDLGVNDVQQQSELHLLLSHNGCEREHRAGAVLLLLFLCHLSVVGDLLCGVNSQA